MIFLSDLNHDLNQRFKSNDLNHNNPGVRGIKMPNYEKWRRVFSYDNDQ